LQLNCLTNRGGKNHEIELLKNQTAKATPSIEIVELCNRVLEMLNLPSFMANPLVARSLMSSLRHRNDAISG